MPLDVKALGAELAAVVSGQLAPVIERLKAVEARAPEKGERGDNGLPGRDGDPGPAGKDAPAVDEKALAERVAQTVAAMLPDLVARAVGDYLKANPPAAGRDGKDGERGEKGDTGPSGAGVAGALIDRDGVLKLTMSDGRVEALGPVVGRDGTNGADGKDGLSLEAFELGYIAETHEITVTAKCAGRAQELRIPAGGVRPGGYWREGTRAKALELWVHDGSAYMALKETGTRPVAGDDWMILARRGRDGERGARGPAGGEPAPIKLATAGG